MYRGSKGPFNIPGNRMQTMIEITSTQNTIIKEVRSLKNRKDREEKGFFFIEGARIVEEALAAEAPISYAILAESYDKTDGGHDAGAGLESAGVKCYVVPDGLFESLCDTRSPQGILAVLKIEPPELHEARFSNGIFILLENVRDPGNMGTIIRTADAAGFTGVIATGGCVDVYNPKVLRSTMGSVFHLPVYFYEDTIDAIKLLKANGIRIVASHLSCESTIYQTDLKIPTAFVIGSEAEGISRKVEAEADLLVKIPMPGRAESLNASIAAGVIMFEAVRQRLAND